MLEIEKTSAFTDAVGVANRTRITLCSYATWGGPDRGQCLSHESVEEIAFQGRSATLEFDTQPMLLSERATNGWGQSWWTHKQVCIVATRPGATACDLNFIRPLVWNMYTGCSLGIFFCFQAEWILSVLFCVFCVLVLCFLNVLLTEVVLDVIGGNVSHGAQEAQKS